jgi:hypothetical protein
MSRDDGFAVADVDSSYFDDAKMRDLWNALGNPDRMARAICLHESTVLASWRAGCRVTVAQAVPLWLAVDPELVDALRKAKLLDRAGKVPAASWDDWFGAAYSRREARRESGRIGGIASAQRRALPGEATPKRRRKQPLSVAEPVRPSVRPSVPPGPTDRPSVAREAPSKNGARGGDPVPLVELVPDLPEFLKATQ